MNRDPVTQYVQWCRTKGLSEPLIRRRSAFLRFAETVIGCPLLKASTEDIGRVLADAQHRGLCDATRHVYAGHLRSFFNWAVDNRLARRNPVIGAPVPRRPRYLPRPIADDRLALAFAAAEPRVRVVLALAAMGALRACEIARLRREDILDHLGEPVLLVQGKGDKPRALALSSVLLAELHRYGLPRRGPVIRRLDGIGGHVSASLISLIANQHLHELGITDTLHSLRHAAASALYRDTRDIRLVQEVLGHSSPAVTACYVEWVREEAPSAMERLAGRLTPGVT